MSTCMSRPWRPSSCSGAAFLLCCLSQELARVLWSSFCGLPARARAVTPGRCVSCGAKNSDSRRKKLLTNNSDMAEVKSMFREVLPKQGQLSTEDITTLVLCKPKLLPLKSLTLEKLEKMQQAAQDTIRQQEMAEKEKEIIH